ncbi:hypothetical protein T439DRAFT_43530 [Meredithblackwellia eburnea MCA 4105]
MDPNRPHQPRNERDELMRIKAAAESHEQYLSDLRRQEDRERAADEVHQQFLQDLRLEEGRQAAIRVHEGFLSNVRLPVRGQQTVPQAHPEPQLLDPLHDAANQNPIMAESSIRHQHGSEGSEFQHHPASATRCPFCWENLPSSQVRWEGHLKSNKCKRAEGALLHEIDKRHNIDTMEHWTPKQHETTCPEVLWARLQLSGSLRNHREDTVNKKRKPCNKPRAFEEFKKEAPGIPVSLKALVAKLEQERGLPMFSVEEKQSFASPHAAGGTSESHHSGYTGIPAGVASTLAARSQEEQQNSLSRGSDYWRRRREAGEFCHAWRKRMTALGRY